MYLISKKFRKKTFKKRADEVFYVLNFADEDNENKIQIRIEESEYNAHDWIEGARYNLKLPTIMDIRKTTIPEKSAKGSTQLVLI